MKVCVFGAGAVGGNLAVRLAAGGADVSVVARGAQLEAVRARGLCVAWNGSVAVAHPLATDDAASLGTQDAVLVTLKEPAIAAAAPAIATLLGPDTPCIFAVNGIPWWYRPSAGGALPMLDPAGAIAAAIGSERTVGGVVHVACHVGAPGEIELTGPVNALIMGVPEGAASPALRQLAGILQAGGVAAECVDNIRQAVWRKLALNLASGPLAVLGAAALPRLYAEPAVADAARALLAETGAIAAAEGVDAIIDPTMFLAQARTIAHKPSILQDLEAGRPMEIAALLDAPLEIARRHYIPAPVLTLIAGLIRVRAQCD